ncbi:hypothetical protein ABH926_004580 [Catenulispora sp. GP43]|uniref:DUF4232 domain-containing protein n=1 Tax=Catenulispora sp. GP43 TaxID=3156263 RepID=UPI0035195EB1
MNRISVLFAAGALGAAALTAGCSGSTAKSAGAAGASTPGTPSSVASTSSPASGQNPDAGTGSTSASSPAAGTSSSPNPGTTSSAPPSAPTHAAGTACTTTEMPSGTWRTVPDSQGAGHVAADIAFQNTSSHTCTVAGFPGISLLASNDHSLPTNVLKDNSVAVTTISVAPGAWVHAEMRYSPNIPGPGEPQNGQCEPMTVHAVAQLPGDSAWSRVTLDNPTTVCEKGELQVKPFVSGQSSPDGG